MSGAPVLELVGATRRVQGRDLVSEVSLSLRKGEMLGVIGPNGSGKSTLLNLIAGLTEVTRGGIILDGREITGPGPDRAVVFQNHSLLPWMTCFGNVHLAVEKIFGVTVTSVNTANRQGKRKRTRFGYGTRKSTKRALVTLSADSKPIEIFGGPVA